jgi:hypothetical protein
LEEEKMWITKDSTHYVFHFENGSLAEKEIEQVMEIQENCHKNITETLKVTTNQKIGYWLCDTRELVAKESEYHTPINGITCYSPDHIDIYAVYNDEKKCIGYHEDTHAIAVNINDPTSYAIAEGLAMYFDRVWWNVNNDICTKVYLLDDKYISIEQMVCNNDIFNSVPDMISYPIMGAFTNYIIEQNGIDKYIELYRQKGDDWRIQIEQVLGHPLREIEEEFIASIMKREHTEDELERARKVLYRI